MSGHSVRAPQYGNASSSDFGTEKLMRTVVASGMMVFCKVVVLANVSNQEPEIVHTKTKTNPKRVRVRPFCDHASHHIVRATNTNIYLINGQHHAGAVRAHTG